MHNAMQTDSQRSVQMDKHLHLTDPAEIKKLADGIEDAREFILHSVVQAEIKSDDTSGARVGATAGAALAECFVCSVTAGPAPYPRSASREGAREEKWVNRASPAV